VLRAGLVDVLSSVPIGVFFIGHGDDLADGEVEIVLVARGVFIQGLDLERHGGAARGQQRSQAAAAVEAVEAGVEAMEATAGLAELELPASQIANVSTIIIRHKERSSVARRRKDSQRAGA
jgi:hypothetical protein